MQYVCTIVLKVNRLLGNLVSKRQKRPTVSTSAGSNLPQMVLCKCERPDLYRIAQLPLSFSSSSCPSRHRRSQRQHRR